MRIRNTFMAGLCLVAGLATLPAIAQPQLSNLMSTRGAIAQAPKPPFPLDGKPVFVSQQSGQWQEARLAGYRWDSRTGFRYDVMYTNNQVERQVGVDRIITLETARQKGIATKAYDVASQSGVTQMLTAHNTWRKRYGVPPLTWSPQLASYAQEWANKLARENRFSHRPNNRYGENLASATGQQMSPDQVVNMWGNEVADYNYASNTCKPGKMCGHYTQVVWKTTTQLGCGMARNGNREVWVCNYNPPGNYVGRKPY